DQPGAAVGGTGVVKLKAVEKSESSAPAGNPESPPTTTPSLTQDPQAGPPMAIQSAALTVIAVIGAMLVLQYAQAMIIPIVLGVLISYALEPIVVALTRLRLPRRAARRVVLSPL